MFQNIDLAKGLIILFVLSGLAGLTPMTGRLAPEVRRMEAAAPLDEVVLPVTQDAFSAPGVDEPTGHSDVLLAGYAEGERSTFMQFDVSDVVIGSDVDVRLELYCTGYEADPDSTLELQFARLVESWDEDLLPYPAGIDEGSLFEVDLGTCDIGGEWKVVRNTELLGWVVNWATGDHDNHGLRIGPASTDSMRLYSFVASNGEPTPPPGKGPRLVFEYTPYPTLVPGECPPVSHCTPGPFPTPCEECPTLTPWTTPGLDCPICHTPWPMGRPTVCPPLPRCTPGPAPTSCSPPGSCPTPTPGCPPCDYETPIPTETLPPTFTLTPEPTATSTDEPLPSSAIHVPIAYNNTAVRGVTEAPPEAPPEGTPTPFGTVCPPIPRCTPGPRATDCIPPGSCPTVTPGCPACEPQSAGGESRPARGQIPGASSPPNPLTRQGPDRILNTVGPLLHNI